MYMKGICQMKMNFSMKEIFCMKDNLLLLLLLPLLLILSGCSESVATSQESQLVVEGWIDAGEFPVVKLTRTVPLSSDNLQLDSLSRYVDRWAKVSISDGEKTEVLVGRYDDSYFPPFIYTTYSMRGEVGREYRLRVEASDGKVAEATTRIPAPVAVDSFRVEKTEVDSLFQLYAYVNGRQPCKFFTQVVNSQTEMFSAELGLFDADMLADSGKASVKRGRYNLVKDYTPFFKRYETVRVKLSTLNADGYAFWRSFEDMIALSRLPLVSVNANLKSNVSGAYGYWLGYGSAFYEVSIADLLKVENKKFAKNAITAITF